MSILQIHVVDSLQLSADELERARARVALPLWHAAGEKLRHSADEAAADAALPDMDAAWFDADPQRDFAETYVPFHRFLRPVTDMLARGRLLAWSAMLLQEPRYLERAREILLHVIRGLPTHVRHHDSGMEYGRLAVQLTELYACLKPHLAPADCEQATKQFNAIAHAILAGTEHWLTTLRHMPYSNHFAFHRHGLLAIGITLDRRDWIDEAIDGRRGFGEMLNGATFDTGLCYESSTRYHYATLHALMGMAELVRHQPNLGRDLYRESFANGRTLKQMIDAPLDLLFSNGELPPAGDCYADRTPLWHARDTYELAYRVYRDPRHAWLISRAPRTGLSALLFGVDAPSETTPPGGKSRVWIEHGYCLLTTAATTEAYWDPASTAPAAFLSIDRNGIHHHLDRMGLQMAAAGRIWLEDIESRAVASEGHGFSNPIQSGFNRTTLPHNLVMIDEQSQKPSYQPLQFLRFSDLPDVKTVTVADDSGVLYAGVAQRRSVIVTPDYMLDIYQVDSGSEARTADLLLHPRADGAVIARAGEGTDALRFAPDATLPDRAPYRALRDVASAPIAGPVSLAWDQGDATCRLDLSLLDGEGAANRLFSASWPIQSDWQTGGRQMLFLRARGTRCTFLSLYQVHPGSVTAPWRIASSERYFNGLADEIRVCVTKDAERRWHILPA